MHKDSQDNKIILASASPRRSELLARAGVPFDVIVSHVDECNDSHIAPRELVLKNARMKSADVSAKNCGRLVLGADTIVVLDGIVYGKPHDLIDAVRMLKNLRGRTHTVYTGIAVSYTDCESAETRTIVDCGESNVSFKNLSDSQIDDYISKVNVLDKAGAYAAQEFGSMIIERIDGDFDNVMGLPCALSKNLLDRAHLRLHA